MFWKNFCHTCRQATCKKFITYKFQWYIKICVSLNNFVTQIRHVSLRRWKVSTKYGFLCSGFSCYSHYCFCSVVNMIDLLIEGKGSGRYKLLIFFFFIHLRKFLDLISSRWWSRSIFGGNGTLLFLPNRNMELFEWWHVTSNFISYHVLHWKKASSSRMDHTILDMVESLLLRFKPLSIAKMDKTDC